MACWPCRSWPLKTSRAKCGGQDRMGITTLHGHCIELADIAAIPKGEREKRGTHTHQPLPPTYTGEMVVGPNPSFAEHTVCLDSLPLLPSSILKLP